MSRMIVGFVLLLIVSTFAPARAQTATSESFLLEMGELLDGEPQTMPLLRSSPPLRNNPNNGWYNGFPQSASASTALQMNVDSLMIDFGALTPGVLLQRDQIVTINSNIPAGYNLYLRQDKPLQLLFPQTTQIAAGLSEREQIPNTTCDDGTCTAEQAGTWTNPDVYGFGYTVVSPNGMIDFATGQAYRSLPNANSGEQPVAIAHKIDTTTTINQEQVQVRYQVGVAPANVAGEYVNTVSYTLIPSF